MNAQRSSRRIDGFVGSAATLLVLGLFGNTTLAADASVSLEPRADAGVNRGRAGTLLARENDGKAWQGVAVGGTVHSRDELLALPGLRASVECSSHAVSLTLAGNLPQLSSFPGLESSVILHDSRAFDCDVTLAHGRIIVKNIRKDGTANVWLRLPTEAWQLTLPHPGDEVALEMYGRWPRGSAFSKKPKTEDAPTRLVTLLVLAGSADLRVGGTQHSLSAPPGAAYFHWDSVAGADPGPQARDSLPSWADPKAETPADATAIAAIAEQYLGQLKERGPDTALLQVLADADKEKDNHRATLMREFAIFGMAANVDLSHAVDALADAKHVDARETAVVALRNWIGALPEHDRQLYRLLIDVQGYTAAEAETIMQLLHSPFVDELPETYETLILYLNHKKLAVRELARWHLYHLAPVGRDIKYDAGAAEADRAKAAKEWKDLIPTGKLPPKEKKKE